MTRHGSADRLSTGQGEFRPHSTVEIGDALVPVGIVLTGSPGGIHAIVDTGGLRAVQATTSPHPGLPTDTAPQSNALLTQAADTSTVEERIYPRRDSHV
ncbi:MAG TPA: hypothetical protein VK545_02095 [Streptomyces sp.]|nr:hypothetical protein [Streptomyces sp.]